MSRDDAYVLDILLAARRALEVVQTISFQTFSEDWKEQSAVQHQLMILGEAVKRLSPEFRERNPQFPWSSIARLRDILIHHYNDVDLNEIWRISQRDLPPLIAFLESLAPQK